jgi:RHS repeat-associated protein
VSGPLPSRLRIGPDSRRFGNNSQWTRTLDQNYAIDAISSAALNLDATLDDVGNFTGLISSGQSYQFGYDPLYRLTELRQGSSVLEHFDYDATGNRTAATLGGSAQSYAYPTNSHRLQSINGVSRDYDNVGNTTQRDGLTYTYNGRNRLSRVSMGRTTYYSNTYNARGEREEKSLTNGMTVQRFIYDEAGRLIQTGNVPPVGLTRTLKPEQRLLWLDDQLVGVKMMKVESNAYAGELLYAHTDHLGTPRALSRASNNSVVWRWPLETSAFGQHPAQTDPDGDGQALTFNLRYPGQYFDSESGLHYNYFRDYEAGVGRYIESDPIGLAAGVATYAYVDSNPLNWTDTLGLAKNKIVERWANCASRDWQLCESICSPRLVASCKRRWILATEIAGGEIVEGWKPGNLSCNCEETFCDRNPGTCAVGAAAVATAVVLGRAAATCAVFVFAN